MGEFRAWQGGRVRTKHGKPVWLIERMVNGRRYHIQLDVRSDAAALAELALFERDPVAYQTKADAQVADTNAPEPRLTPDTLKAFLKYLKAEGSPERRPRTERYRKNVKAYLTWWDTKLKGRDLRTVKLRDLHAALDTETTARKQRIIVIKSFCTWLRQRGDIERQHDATLDLPVPKPERVKRFKGYPMHQLEALYPFIADTSVRAVIAIRCKTGMHHTEIDRLAHGEGEIIPLSGQGQIAGVLYFDHKKGAPHIVSVDTHLLGLAQHLRERGACPAESWIYKQTDLAAAMATEKTGKPVESIRPGELRHSFAQWAENFGERAFPARRGIPLEGVSAAMGHESTSTTHRFYRGLRIPPLTVLPLNLSHHEDPEPRVSEGSVHPLAERFAG